MPSGIRYAYRLVDDDVVKVAAELRSEDTPPGLAVVTEYAALEKVAEQRLRACVRISRREGMSWETIGKAIGVSRQAATERFGR